MSKNGWFGIAALSLSSMAFAQSSPVTLYGVIDIGIDYTNHVDTAGNHLFSMAPSNIAGSRWGMRGAEDLGGGVQAIFTLESGFTPDTGVSAQGGRLFGRKAIVGLKDARLGQLTLGRQTNTLFDFSLDYDPMAIATRYGLTVQDSWFSARADNSVKYDARFGPVGVKAFYSFGYDGKTAGAAEVPGNSKVGREMAASLDYSNGPLRVGGAYDIVYGTSVATQSDREQRAAVAAIYDFTKVKAYVGYRWYDGRFSGQATRSDLWWAGISVPVTPALTLTGAAYYQDFKGTNADPLALVLNADYSLSKRTFLYSSVGYTVNRNGSSLGS
ncbi:Outer membrane porin protein (plasmid) [Ralstonia syzygii]|uniref:porin n=1 Tax=Ralstonia syzygii TaxID=28097 RepID=UPI0036F3B179